MWIGRWSTTQLWRESFSCPVSSVCQKNVKNCHHRGSVSLESGPNFFQPPSSGWNINWRLFAQSGSFVGNWCIVSSLLHLLLLLLLLATSRRAHRASHTSFRPRSPTLELILLLGQMDCLFVLPISGCPLEEEDEKVFE